MLKILDKTSYQNLLQEFSDYHYIQSEEHNYQQIMYGNCHYVAFYDGRKHPVILFKFATTKFLKNHKFALGSFGPIINTDKVSRNTLSRFFDELSIVLKKQNIAFIQLFPVSVCYDNQKIINLINDSHPRLEKSFHKYTWIDGTMVVDLNVDLEQMFKSFRKDVKYNIKRAERDNIVKTTIHEKASNEIINKFFELYDKQQERKDFNDRATEFYRDLFENNKVILFEASYNSKMVSAIMAVKFEAQKSLITYISASTQEGFKTKAPTLLRWELIKWAKNNGFEKVDFFSLDKNTPSVSNFKRGFRPKEIEYMENAYNLVIDSKIYKLYKIFFSIRKLTKNIIPINSK